jgi:hypothetical protein
VISDAVPSANLLAVTPWIPACVGLTVFNTEPEMRGFVASLRSAQNDRMEKLQIKTTGEELEMTRLGNAFRKPAGDED